MIVDYCGNDSDHCGDDCELKSRHMPQVAACIVTVEYFRLHSARSGH
jgi:hypothetical protein